MKKNKILSAIAGILILLTIICQGNQTDLSTINIKSGQETGQKEQDADSPKAEMSVHYIDVGQADATLLVCGEDAMLIDGGDNACGTKLQNYITKQGITKLDYVIGTHPDSDHYGGLDVIVTKFDCGTIILPEYEKETATARDVYDAIDYRGYSVTYPKPGQQFYLGEAAVTILAPLHYDYGSCCNNYSICLRVDYGDISFLFTGDAETEVENELLAAYPGQLKADVYHVGHHGSKTSSCEEFVAAVDPKYAVISCGENNEYGHPHMQTLNTLRSRDIEVYRTDEQGTIICSTNGDTLTFNMPPSTSWTDGY